MIALILQYHLADREQAATLCRLLVDIERTRRTDVVVRLVARWDCPQLDMEVIQKLASRFDVSWGKTSKHKWAGWPDGPNGMAKEILETSPKWLKEAGWTEVNGLYLIEPDNVPLCREWLDRIVAQWGLARSSGAWIMGSWRNSGPAGGHINGNSVFTPEQAKFLAGRIHEGYAWDCAVSQVCGPNGGGVNNHWHRSGLFLNKFQSYDATEAELMKPECGHEAPVVAHGYKDGSAMAVARRWMNLP